MLLTVVGSTHGGRRGCGVSSWTITQQPSLGTRYSSSHS